ncbi:MAG: DinB family protein [Bacteroidota bacterium]
MIEIAQLLKSKIDAARPRLLSIPETHAADKPYADKWSLKEILGHLIDSVANNHQRIVRMQQSVDIGNFTYEQQPWVSVQHYATEPWEDLVEFWYHYNTHLAHIIRHVDPGSLQHSCDMGYAKPATLKFVIEDYVRHVEHHLGQIFGGADPRKRGTWVRRDPGERETGP